MNTTTQLQSDSPDFDEVREGLDPGIYCAEYLNPPSGDDCTHLLVREDGSLSGRRPTTTRRN